MGRQVYERTWCLLQAMARRRCRRLLAVLAVPSHHQQGQSPLETSSDISFKCIALRALLTPESRLSGCICESYSKHVTAGVYWCFKCVGTRCIKSSLGYCTRSTLLTCYHLWASLESLHNPTAPIPPSTMACPAVELQVWLALEHQRAMTMASSSSVWSRLPVCMEGEAGASRGPPSASAAAPFGSFRALHSGQPVSPEPSLRSTAASGRHPSSFGSRRSAAAESGPFLRKSAPTPQSTTVSSFGRTQT